jgi:hypothetical protein
MGVSSGRSRVADLAFHVFTRALHPDWFAVHRSSRIVQTSWEADVRIIEGGHAVVWASGGSRVTEILSGREVPLPEPGLLFHSPIRHERSVVLRPGPRVEYQTCFEADRVDPEVFAHLSEELTLDSRRGGLFHRFARTNRMAPPPLSHLQIEARTRGLSIQAIHTFPDERAIVRSQSLFEICD